MLMFAKCLMCLRRRQTGFFPSLPMKGSFRRSGLENRGDIQGDYDCSDFIQIFDGKIIVDREGQGKALQAKVQSYLQNRPQKSRAEIDASVNWCIKMLARVKRCDAEGMFRWHWVLIDSLEIFCDVMRQPYWGPKKSLKWMEENHPTAFACYQTALTDLSMESLENWILYIKNANGTV